MNKDYHRSLQLVCGMIILSQIALVGIALFNASDTPAASKDIKQSMLFIVPVFFVGCLITSAMVFKNISRRAEGKEDIRQTLNIYRTATVIRYALLEAPSILAVVAYFLTNEIMYLAITGALILFLLILFPSKVRTMRDLSLSDDDISGDW